MPHRRIVPPLETVATFTARRVSLLITVLILHLPCRFDNRLLVTAGRVPTKVTTGETLLVGYEDPWRSYCGIVRFIALGFGREVR